MNELNTNGPTPDSMPEPVAAASRPKEATRVNIVTLLTTAVLVAAAICTLGWFTNLRLIAHTATISAGVFLGLPFAIILFGVALGMFIAGLMLLISVLGALFGGSADVNLADGASVGEPFVEMGTELISPYYRLLSRIRHPMIWGFVFGVLSGGVLLCCLLWFIIIPGETATVQTLADVRDKIAEVYKRTGRFPPPDANGNLAHSEIGGTSTGVVLDGFGNSLEYRVTGLKAFAKVHVRSLGFDGVRGKDDLCISDATSLRKWAEAVKLDRGVDGNRRLSIKIAFTSIQDMQCKD